MFQLNFTEISMYGYLNEHFQLVNWKEKTAISNIPMIVLTQHNLCRIYNCTCFQIKICNSTDLKWHNTVCLLGFYL